MKLQNDKNCRHIDDDFSTIKKARNYADYNGSPVTMDECLKMQRNTDEIRKYLSDLLGGIK